MLYIFIFNFFAAIALGQDTSDLIEFKFKTKTKGISWKSEWPTEKKKKCGEEQATDEYQLCLIQIAKKDAESKKNTIVNEAKEACYSDMAFKKCRLKNVNYECTIINTTHLTAVCIPEVTFVVSKKQNKTNFEQLKRSGKENIGTTPAEARALRINPSKVDQK